MGEIRMIKKNTLFQTVTNLDRQRIDFAMKSCNFVPRAGWAGRPRIYTLTWSGKQARWVLLVV